MAFRFLKRVLLTAETLGSITVGLLVTMMICLEYPANELDPNLTNRLFGHLIEAVIIIAAVLGCLRVGYEERHHLARHDGHFGLGHVTHH